MDLNGLAPIRKIDIGILRQTLNTDNVNTDDSQIGNKSIEHLPEIFRLIASLEEDTQKMLLDSWAKLEMPLNEKTVSQLLDYLENKPALTSDDKMAVIKAFAFLKSNGIPYSESFVDALRSIFNKNGNLASSLEQYLTSNSSLSEEQFTKLLENLNLADLKSSISDLKSFTENFQLPLAQEGTELNQTVDLQNAQLSQNSNENINDNLLKADLLNNFNNLDQEFKTLILNNLDTLAQNFNKDTIKILNNFLAANNIESTSEKISLLKSFAFLEKNQLPLNESLINEIKTVFQNTNIETELGEIENKNTLFENLINSNSAVVNENESTINLNSETAKIAENLNNFSKISDQIVSLFNKSGGENEKEISDNFLGQKLVNLQQQDLNTPLMLALEIPVKLKDNQLSSLLLKIEKEANKSSNSEKIKSGFNITFILEFENIGPIKNKININEKQINTRFFTEKAETAALIKDNIAKLQSSLYDKGFEINRVRIENFSNYEEEKNNFFNKIILAEINDRDENGKYRHIDIKI